MTLSIKRLSLSEAAQLIEGARQDAHEIGVPMCIAVVDGEVVGGIGLSSGTPQQDMQCAQAGLDFYSSDLLVVNS